MLWLANTMGIDMGGTGLCDREILVESNDSTDNENRLLWRTLPRILLGCPRLFLKPEISKIVSDSSITS